MKYILTLTALLTMATVSADSALSNGSFEQGISPWELNYEKSGSMSAVTGIQDFIHSGTGSLKMEAGEKSLIKIFNRGNYIQTSPGQRWKFKVWAKGHGVFKFGVYEYGEPTDKLGLYSLGFTWSPGFNLNERWQCFEYQYTGQPSRLSKFLAAFEVSGSNAVAYLDDAELVKDSTAGWRLNLLQRNLTGYPGCTLELEATLLYNQNPAAGENVTIDSRDLGSGGGLRQLQTDAGGKINWQSQLPANQPAGVKQISVVHSKAGLGEMVYADVITEAQYYGFEKAGPIRNPGIVLVIGDSLSDFLRGYNYVDTVAYFTGKLFPGQCLWRNYGIGGDTAPRCVDRLNGKKNHAWKRYAGIFEVKPNLVIIFLGHNDSLLLDKTLGAQSPLQVPREKFKEKMLELIQIIRKECDNPEIVLLTPILPDYEKSLKNCSNLKIVFGEPSIMAQYRDLVQETGRIAGCPVIDVFTPTANYPNRDELFHSDGIHLTSAGNKIIAAEIFKYLRKKD